jgi:spore coat polysaccharide biosynthesis protein SpsF
MLPLAGQPAIFRVFERAITCERLDEIVVATSTNPEDDAIAELFDGRGVRVFRGSPDDPLDRYYRAATHFGFENVVRLMGDCPLVDPMVLDDVVSRYLEHQYDFCCLSGEFPAGLDVTVFSCRALETAFRNARLPSEREHVTPYITNHPELFRIGSRSPFDGLGYLR